MFVKICGITNLDDALDAIELGVDALGFDFCKDSLRYVDPLDVEKMLEDIPPSIQKVGLFVNEQEELVKDLSQILSLDILQFHGDETPYYCEQFATPYWKSFQLQDTQTLKLMDHYKPEAFVIDPCVETIWGGKGMTAHWDLIAAARRKGKIVLSGNLNEENIDMVLSTAKPYGVDIGHGIEESPGRKNRMKLEILMDKIRGLEEFIGKEHSI